MMSLQLLVIPVLMTFVDKFSDEWYRYTSENTNTRAVISLVISSGFATSNLSFLRSVRNHEQAS